MDLSLRRFTPEWLGFHFGSWRTRWRQLLYLARLSVVSLAFLNGDAYGSPTGSSFGIVYPEGTMAYAEYGPQPLWPAEIWEGQWDFIVFAILLIMKNKTWPKGFLFLSYNILYAIGRFMLEFLRGDSPRYLFNWTAGQWTSVVVIVISLVIMMIFTLRQKRKDPEDLSPKLEQIH